MTNDLEQRIAALTPEQRILFEQRLMEHARKTSRYQAILPRERSDTCPLSFAQERFWYLDRLGEDAAVYNIHACYRLSGPLDVDALRRSLTWLLTRHEVLRSVYKNSESGLLQVVHPAGEFPLSVVDLTHVPAEQRDQTIGEYQKHESTTPFDLEKDQMLRVKLLRFAPDLHVLVLTVHHIASDGWAMGRINYELSEAYNAFRNGEEPTLPEPTLQYADFSVWQRQWLQGERHERQLKFWREALDGAPTVIDLPIDHPRPAILSDEGDSIHFALDTVESAALKTLARESGATLFMALFAAYNVLLYRYTGQSDLIVGVPIAGRHRTELEGMVGCFINTLPIRTRIDPHIGFRALLAQIRASTMSAFDNQDLPIEQIIEALGIAHSMAHPPLVQVMFNLHNMPSAALRMEGLAAETLRWSPPVAKLELTLTMSEREGELQGALSFSTDLFARDTVERMAANLRVLLESICREPDTPVSRLSILTPEERNKLLVEWNSAPAVTPDFGSLPELFRCQVETRPDAPALYHAGVTLTYAELAERVHRLAAHLRQRGIRPGTVVGVCMERSPEVIAALLAIYQVGAVYLPLDPAYPAERLRYMLEDEHAALLLTNEQGRTLLTSTGEKNPALQIVSVEHLQSGSEEGIDAPAAADDVVPSDPSPDDVAYIIYTSGSTGKPKGVAVPHRQILNRLTWMWRDYPILPGEVGCLKTALSFVDSLWELFGYLLQGAPTAIAPDAAVRDPAQLVEFLAEHRVTRLWLVPALLRAMLDVYPDLKHRLPACKFWVVSGEALPTDLLRRFQAALPSATLYNLYGTSEVWDATWYDPIAVDTGAHDRCVLVPIGKPIAGTQAYVLDEYLQPVPIGVRGELCIGGVGLGYGYLNQPALSAERFVPNPFSGDGSVDGSDARLYRSGDRARILADGHIEFLGRTDFQVKLRGFRIELSEIEDTLRRIPQVRDAVVVKYDFGEGDERLVAYVVTEGADGGGMVYDPQDQVGSHSQALSDLCLPTLRETLPSFMIPSLFVAIERMPKTPSGKVNRLALPKPMFDEQTRDGLVEPRTPLEAQIAAMIAEAVRRPRVSIDHDFFALGGHSLLASRLVARLRNELDVDLSLRSLFETPTAAGLAAQVEQLLAEQSAQSVNGDGHPTAAAMPACSTPAFASLVEVKRSAPGKLPFFLVPGGGGSNEELLAYANLLHRLGPDQPVYALLARGLDGKLPPHDSVERMVEDYVTEIRALQPEGPYLLGGECTGGKVAFEMARRLADEGAQVALLVLLDTFLALTPTRSRNPLKKVLGARTRRRARHHLRRIQGMSPRGWLNYFLERIGGRLPIDPAIQPNQNGSAGKVNELHVMHKYQQLVIDYVPAQPYVGKLTLFVSANSRGHEIESAWRMRAAGEMETYRVAGDHFSYLGTHVEDTAARLRECLAQAQLNNQINNKVGA